MTFKITKEHLEFDGKPIQSLEQATKTELEHYISKKVRQVSPKTGRMIKINTYKKPKSFLLSVIRFAELENKAIKWINQYYHLSIVMVDELELA